MEKVPDGHALGCASFLLHWNPAGQLLQKLMPSAGEYVPGKKNPVVTVHRTKNYSVHATGNKDKNT